MIVNNLQLNKFFAKAQQATQVVELTLTYARKVNSFGDFNYLNTLPPFQVRSRSVVNPFLRMGENGTCIGFAREQEGTCFSLLSLAKNCFVGLRPERAKVLT